MNYIYVHEGSLPSYIVKSLENTLKIDPNAKILFCNNQKFFHQDIESIQIDNIISKRTLEIQKKDFFKAERNLLWLRSLLRIFYLRDLVNKLNIDKFVHFDSDVLIFKAFNDIKYDFSKTKFNITPLSDDEIIFGYSCSLNNQNFNNVVTRIENYLLKFNDDEAKSLLSKDLNEMKLLKIIIGFKKERVIHIQFRILNLNCL